MYPGRFITFEGGEGSGKTTQLVRLAADLKDKGFDVVQTREPGGTPLGNDIRALLLNRAGGAEITPKTELLLYLASRAQHVSEVILPALKAGKIVLCDRFTDATLAYQGDGRRLPGDMVEVMTQFAASGLEPDLTLFLDVAVQTGLTRIKDRAEINRIDRECLQFHEAVYAGYQRLAQAHPKRIVVIDASAAVDVVALKIRERVHALLS
ncbi:MAG: dTMP kinase [Nitrospiria bacterium]